MSRIICRLFGHAWAPTFGDWQACTRRSCRGRLDAMRRVR